MRVRFRCRGWQQTQEHAMGTAVRSRMSRLERLESRVLFAAGDLDSLFAGGKVLKDVLGGDEYGYAVAVQSDGKVLVAGQTVSTMGSSDFAVARFNSNGTIDS